MLTNTIEREGVWTRLVGPLAHATPDDVRAQLDAVVPGEWDLTLDLLDNGARDGRATFKARLQILGVIREAVGSGASSPTRIDFTSAADAAFLAVARRFGVGVMEG